MNKINTEFSQASVAKHGDARNDYNHIRIGYYMMLDGQEALIEDFEPKYSYFSKIDEREITLPTPSAESNDVRVKVNGAWHKYDDTRMQALPVNEQAVEEAGLKIGQRIRAVGCDDTIKRIRMMRRHDQQQPQIILDCSVLVNCTYDPHKVHIFKSDGKNGYSLGYART